MFNCAILVIDTPVVVHVKVVDFPVMAQMTFSLVSADLELSQLQSIDQVFDVLVAQVQQIVRCRGKSRDPTVAARFSWTVVACPLCATTCDYGR